MTISIRPPFTLETALAKVRAAEDAWNSRDPVRVSLAYSTDSIWRNRASVIRVVRKLSLKPGAKLSDFGGTHNGRSHVRGPTFDQESRERASTRRALATPRG